MHTEVKYPKKTVGEEPICCNLDLEQAMVASQCMEHQSQLVHSTRLGLYSTHWWIFVGEETKVDSQTGWGWWPDFPLDPPLTPLPVLVPIYFSFSPPLYSLSHLTFYVFFKSNLVCLQHLI